MPASFGTERCSGSYVIYCDADDILWSLNAQNSAFCYLRNGHQVVLSPFLVENAQNRYGINNTWAACHGKFS